MLLPLFEADKTKLSAEVKAKAARLIRLNSGTNTELAYMLLTAHGLSKVEAMYFCLYVVCLDFKGAGSQLAMEGTLFNFGNYGIVVGAWVSDDLKYHTLNYLHPKEGEKELSRLDIQDESIQGYKDMINSGLLKLSPILVRWFGL